MPKIHQNLISQVGDHAKQRIEERIHALNEENLQVWDKIELKYTIVIDLERGSFSPNAKLKISSYGLTRSKTVE